MSKPRAGNIDIFCSKFSQSNTKGLLKPRVPVSKSVILSTGQGHGQAKKGHKGQRKVTRIKKIVFRSCGTRYIVIFTRRNQKSKPYCNLTPCKSTIKEDQVNPGSHEVKFSNSYFRKLLFIPSRPHAKQLSPVCLELVRRLPPWVGT